MSSQAPKLPLSKRWPIAFWSGVVFCFFVFPVFLVDVGLESMLATRSELHKQAVYRDLGKNLERLLQYGNSRHYYHALLKKVFDIASRQADPVPYLKKALANLHATNPGTFKFIVWDKNGATIDELTEEKSFKYIVKTLFEVFTDLYKDSRANYPGFPPGLESVEKRLNLLRSYLGAFLIPEKLNLPLLRANLGECVMASGDSEKAYFWYQIGEKFSMFASVDRAAIESDDYLEKLVRGMNTSSKLVKYGICDLLRGGKIYTDIAEDLKPELVMGLAKFENFSQQQLETEHYLLLVRILTPSIRSFCFITKKDAMLDNSGLRKIVLFSASILIFCLSALMFYLVFRRKRMFSIRWKLALLFIYANGLPLVILGFIGFEYLQQTRRVLLDQAYEQISGLFNDFDSRFTTIKVEYAEKLNHIVDGINKRNGSQPLTEGVLKEIQDFVVKTRCYDSLAVDRLGKLILVKPSTQKSNNFFANMGKNLLDYVNFQDFTPQELFMDDVKTSGARGKIKAETFLSGKQIVFHEILHRMGSLNPEQMGAEERQYYWNFFGDYETRQFPNLITVSWSFETLQEAYLKRNLATLDHNFGQIKCYAMVESNGITFPDNLPVDRSVFSIFRQTFNLRMVQSDEVVIDGVAYAAFGTMGKQLSKVAMVGLYPLVTINNRVNEIRFRLIVFALLSLSLTTGIGWMLSAQFMEPVKELGKGVQAIGRQDFRYRLPVKTADEFGRLGNVFNRAIESLEDLEVAKIVQDNLFPQENLKMNNLLVFGRSVAMTRLGGDYYDFFALDSGKAGVLMGDVAGHGVPAALLMAMAKASVLLSEEARYRPSLLLATLHRVIHRVKSSKIKRMMTCQYFCIDSNSGEYTVSNAGHCFPALIRKNGSEVELLKIIGTPLGITKNPKYDDISGKLEPGDVLLLYTDGIIESQNGEGLEMGFDRFTQLLTQEFESDLETYYQRIFNAYKNWAAVADDDITMVLIEFCGKEGGL